MLLVQRMWTYIGRSLARWLGLCLALTCTSVVSAATIDSEAVVIPVPPIAIGTPALLPVVPNDPRFESQWYLRQIGAPQAWSVSTGTRSVIVAVIDGGVDITHPDLRENIWTNRHEEVRDESDNDGNGFVDDLHGWNFVTNSPDVRPVFTPVQLEDAWSHGTMVASLLGAKGNDGIGMTGVAWNIRLMPLVVLDAEGSGRTSHIIKAIRYAVNMGAHVINLSLVGDDDDPALDEMIRRAADAGVVIVAATGNDDTSKRGRDLDKTPGYPVCADLGRDAVIGVGGTDALDQKAPHANFGTRCTDLSAPGHSLLVARPSYPHHEGPLSRRVPAYREGVIGTSLAAPLVSGAAALLKSVHPDWTPLQIRTRLYETADRLDATTASGTRGTFGYGRLNIGRALTEPPIVVMATATATATTVTTSLVASSTQEKVSKPAPKKPRPRRSLQKSIPTLSSKYFKHL